MSRCKLLQKAEKKGVRIGCKVMLDEDSSHIYTVNSMFFSTEKVLVGLLGNCNLSWNANSSRLSVLVEEGEGE